MRIKKKFNKLRKENAGEKEKEKIFVPSQGINKRKINLDMFGKNYSRKMYLKFTRGSSSTLSSPMKIDFSANNSLMTRHLK